MSKNVFSIITTVTCTILCITAACKKEKNNSLTPHTPITDTVAGQTPAPLDTTVYNYLALGDSYTIGQSIDSADRYSAQAAALLQKKGIQIKTIQYIATSGWTTVNLVTAVEQARLKGPYNIVTLLIGVNDQYQRRDTTGYRENFAQLLQMAIQLAGNNSHHVIVLSVPDYSVTPFGDGMVYVAKQIDEFNLINRQLSVQYNTGYLDITETSRAAKNNPALIAGDNLHFSGQEYHLWAVPLADLMFAQLK